MADDKTFEAWAIQAPDWASPPYFILESSVSDVRREAQASLGKAWAKPGETPMQGWKRAYRHGWRTVRVIVSLKGAPHA